eukprot:6969306-Pyramimonas_sp.AAC.2
MTSQVSLRILDGQRTEVLGCQRHTTLLAGRSSLPDDIRAESLLARRGQPGRRARQATRRMSNMQKNTTIAVALKLMSAWSR